MDIYLVEHLVIINRAFSLVILLSCLVPSVVSELKES